MLPSPLVGAGLGVGALPSPRVGEGLGVGATGAGLGVGATGAGPEVGATGGRAEGGGLRPLSPLSHGEKGDGPMEGGIHSAPVNPLAGWVLVIFQLTVICCIRDEDHSPFALHAALS